MRLTEEEAKERRCCVPFVAYHTHSQFEGKVDPVYDTCIASKCIAWRWDEGSKWRGPKIGFDIKPQIDWKGYCGRAGKPG